MNGAGVADETAINILKAHDRITGTTLLKDAENGNPKLCQSCHADPAVGAEGKPEHMNLSASIHGRHANYMHVEGAAACAMCHPANPNGSTRCARGLHATIGVNCVDCHGTLEEHALSLVKGQADKPSAATVMKNLKPIQVASVDDVNPRIPWLNVPDCLNCHVDFEQPREGFTGFNQWTSGPEELFRVRADYAGVRCQACHGSTHALYPAQNPYGINRDNIQPMQYSNQPYPIGSNKTCETCHIQEMEDPIHHENMFRNIRNQKL